MCSGMDGVSTRLMLVSSVSVFSGMDGLSTRLMLVSRCFSV